MTKRMQNVRTAAAGAFVIAIAFHAWLGSNAADNGGSSSPATVNHDVAEADLLTVTLTPEAERRIGITVAAVEEREVPQMRLYGGEVVVPGSGMGQIATAFPSGNNATLYQLTDARIAAQARVEQAQAQLQGAQTAYERAERMLKDDSGSARAVEEARTAMAVAEAELRGAQARRDLLGGKQAQPSKYWVRTPVFASDLSSLSGADVRVAPFDQRDPAKQVPARRVDGPHSADPVAGTVDLFYEMTQVNGTFQPGQRVQVQIPIQVSGPSLVVPWAAIVHDVNGTAWVYERVREHAYSRRAVQVRAVVGDQAVLRSGPAPGALVAAGGVPELFGTEFGVGH